MTQFYKYRSPTTPAGPGWSVDITGVQAPRLGEINEIIQHAELGAVGISSIDFDDPSGAIGHDDDALIGLKQFDWIETAEASGNQRIFTGYIGDRRYFRGTPGRSPSLRTEAARRVSATLIDINTFLSFRLFLPEGIDATSSFNRPAETDVERVQAMLAVDFLSTTLFDGLVSAFSPVDMDECDYTGQRPVDVLNDCAQRSGKNFFVIYDEAGDYGTAGDYVLFYDFNDSAAYASSMRVSNDLADVDYATIWPPLIDADLHRDPSRVVAGVLIQNGSNSVYRNDLTTSYIYGYRDADGSSPNIKTTAQAEARAVRYLQDNSTEDDRLTFTVKLPAANVNDWKVGQSGMVKFTHLPGYEDFRLVRALVRGVRQDEPTNVLYDVRYEVTPIVVPGEPSGAFDFASSNSSSIPILPRPTTPGNLLVLWVVGAGPTTVFPSSIRMQDNPDTNNPPLAPIAGVDGWTVLADEVSDFTGMNLGGPAASAGQVIAVAYRFVQAGEETTAPVAVTTDTAACELGAWLWEFPTTSTPTLVGSFGRTNKANPNAVYSWTAGAGHLMHGMLVTSVDYGAPPYTITPGTGCAIVNSVSKTNIPDLSPTPSDTCCHSWSTPWAYIAEQIAGGTPSVTFSHITNYTTINAAGIVIALPADAAPDGVPNIPYPANQTP